MVSIFSTITAHSASCLRQICILCIVVMWKDVCRFWITLPPAVYAFTYAYTVAHTLHTLNILYGQTGNPTSGRGHKDQGVSRCHWLSYSKMQYLMLCYFSYTAMQFIYFLVESVWLPLKNTCALIIWCIFVLFLALEILLIMNKKHIKWY